MTIAQQEEVQKEMSVERSTMTNVSQPDDHLNLLIAANDVPWHKSFISNIKDLISPAKLPPLEVTSKPIPVKDIWGDSKNTRKAGLSSMAIHAGAIALIIIVGTNKTVQQKAKEAVTLIAPDIAPYVPAKPQKQLRGR